ncbi:MAG TPA: hypothetical protein VH682_14545 [Gemmataceae bacterium]|jgi:hypothetical protein
MNYLTADQVLLERLAGVMEPAEIRDPGGKVIGRFTPVFADEKEKNERAAKYFDLAEAECDLAEERHQGLPLAEVWKRIHAGEIQG